jgi:hypothetical protein
MMKGLLSGVLKERLREYLQMPLDGNAVGRSRAAEHKQSPG